MAFAINVVVILFFLRSSGTNHGAYICQQIELSTRYFPTFAKMSEKL
jgi:hypothetical protein